MTPYELEAWAFSLAPEEKAHAFLVVSDAFEAAGDIKGAEVRRSWAEQMGCVPRRVRDPSERLIGYYFNIEDARLHLSEDGTDRRSYAVSLWSRTAERRELASDREPLSNAWYMRKGHWNKRKALMKMTIPELVRRNEAR